MTRATVRAFGGSAVAVLLVTTSATAQQQRLMGLGDCDQQDMVSAMSSDFMQYDATFGPSNMNPFNLLPADYDDQMLQQNLFPGGAHIQLSGLVSDGGFSCADPIGDNAMLDYAIEGIVTPQLAARMKTHMDTVKARVNTIMLNPTSRNQIDFRASTSWLGANSPTPGSAAMRESLGFPVSLPPSLLEQVEGSAMFEIYTPNAASWLIGGGVLKPTADMAIYEHPGLYGWQNNAVAHLWVVAPGFKATELRIDQNYPVIIPQIGTDPLYVRTDGAWSHRDPKLHECSFDGPFLRQDGPAVDQVGPHREIFDGQIYVVEPTNPFQGWLEVFWIRNGELRGRVTLSGEAIMRVEQYQPVYSDVTEEDTCEYGGRGKLVRSERVNTSEGRGALSVVAEFRMPVQAATGRDGRRIAHTRKVGTP